MLHVNFVAQQAWIKLGVSSSFSLATRVKMLCCGLEVLRGGTASEVSVASEGGNVKGVSQQ